MAEKEQKKTPKDLAYDILLENMVKILFTHLQLIILTILLMFVTKC